MSHLFEFMDQDWVPMSLRTTLREILELVCSPPIRSYYQWVAQSVADEAKSGGYRHVVELGAGTAPITRILAANQMLPGMTLEPCDITPDEVSFTQLAHQFPGQVEPSFESFDFTKPYQWPEGTLLFLSATLHHIPTERRAAVFRNMCESARCVMVFEPLRKTWLSTFYTPLSMLPALTVPIWFLKRPGFWRRAFWCWCVPAAPLMLAWDGVASAHRMWNRSDWKTNLGGDLQHVHFTETLFCQSCCHRQSRMAAIEKTSTTKGSASLKRSKSSSS